MEKKLEVKNLVISFRTQGGKLQAVRKISFDLYKGETLAIVGESGSGKSVTNRAIMGISAGNAIIEGGEIFYDGQDLLKISEEDFHKIRGDKIAMIFQDPMSSLNPIMKVGRQLTEAMILKSKSASRNSRRDFNSKLALLNKNMNEYSSGNEEEIKSNNDKCKTFDDFCIQNTILENEYNEVERHVLELKTDIDNIVLYIEKKQKIDLKSKIKQVLKNINGTYHPYLVVKDERLTNDLSTLEKNIGEGSASEETLNAFKDISLLLDESSKKETPNYFTLGYYILRNPNENLDNMPIEELNQMARKYIDEEFMIDFIKVGSCGLTNSFKKSVELKKQVLKEAQVLREYMNSDEELNRTIAVQLVGNVGKILKESINHMEIYKNSIEYMFESNMYSSIGHYFSSIKKNEKEEIRFAKQTEKYSKLVAKGKEPDWKVVPKSLVDIKQLRKEMVEMIDFLTTALNKSIEKFNSFDSEKAMVELIDWFKEQASRVTYKVTPKLAKVKAIKLLEEVGISEPAIRYNQYPFEFSGGMRQRIVIAIALAANPDILICDEPTTALDVTIQSQILELINRIKVQRKLSVIFITHDLGVVANMADRVAVMYAGKIVEYGTADDVFYDPKHPYTWALLSSMPDLETKEKLEAIPGTPPNMIYPPKGDAFALRNKYALEIDFEMEPPMFKISDTHYAATWLLHPQAPKIDRPKAISDRIERMKRRGANE